MLKFLQKIKLENLKKVIMETWQRTPLSMLISLAAFTIIVILIRVEDISLVLEDNLNKAVFTLVITFFFSVAIYLYSETKNISRPKKGLYQLITFVFALLFFYFFEENLFRNPEAEIVVYLVLTSLGVLSFIFIASFVSKIKAKVLSQEEFYISTYATVIKTLMSMIVGIITMLLGFIALSSIFTLFDITFIEEDHWFGYWASFSLVFFAPIFFLANLPSVKVGEEDSLEEIQANKFYYFLMNYVALPAIVIYFLILYSYTIKVLLNFSDWPHGEVAWMVILFSFFGYIVYFATYAFTSAFKPAFLLRKILPTAIFLQTFMLFYAIGLRINQYDLTLNRYLVVAFGFWLFGLSLYFIISKKKNLSTPFYTLLIVIIFISIGPWSVYTAPKWRQQGNLEMNLQSANILQADGGVVVLENYRDISVELSGEIYSGISYLCNFHGCDTLDKYFNKEIIEIKKIHREEFEENKKEQLERARNAEIKDEEWIRNVEEREYEEIRNWDTIRKLTEKIKVRAYHKGIDKNEIPKYFDFRNNFEYIDESVDVRGFDYFVQLYSGDLPKDIKEKSLPDTYHARIDTGVYKLDLFFGDGVIETFDIKETVINSLLGKKDNSLEDEDLYRNDIVLANEDMVFNLIGNAYDLKLVLRNISIRNPEWKPADNGDEEDDFEEMRDIKGDMAMEIMPRLDIPYASAYVLIKKK